MRETAPARKSGLPSLVIGFHMRISRPALADVAAAAAAQRMARLAARKDPSGPDPPLAAPARGDEHVGT